MPGCTDISPPVACQLCHLPAGLKQFPPKPWSGPSGFLSSFACVDACAVWWQEEATKRKLNESSEDVVREYKRQMEAREAREKEEAALAHQVRQAASSLLIVVRIV